MILLEVLPQANPVGQELPSDLPFPQSNPVGFFFVIFPIANGTGSKILKVLMHPRGRTPMGDIALELEELRDILAVAQQEISTLEQMTEEVTSIVALCDGEATDPLIRPASARSTDGWLRRRPDIRRLRMR